MNPQELQWRLLFIMHRGFVEARLLAQAQKYQQIFDLADALEPIPSYMYRWEDQHLEAIRFNLRTYQNKHPNSSFDYLRHLEHDPPPDLF